MLALDGLEVDVGGALLDALGDDRVHELDDRRVVGGLAQVDDLGARSSSSTASSRGRRRAGSGADEPMTSSRAVDGRADLVAGHQRDVVDGQHVARVAHRDSSVRSSMKPTGTAS